MNWFFVGTVLEQCKTSLVTTVVSLTHIYHPFSHCFSKMAANLSGTRWIPRSAFELGLFLSFMVIVDESLLQRFRRSCLRIFRICSAADPILSITLDNSIMKAILVFFHFDAVTHAWLQLCILEPIFQPIILLLNKSEASLTL